MLALSTLQGFYTANMRYRCFEIMQHLNLKQEKRNEIATTFN